MKILVIEDELSIRLGLSCVLEDAGHKVASADNGTEGIRLFEKESFDMVITDLRLPGANGIKVLKAVKGISPDTGVIIITAFAEVKTAVEAIKSGAYDYISKPFDPSELPIIIERYVKSKRLEDENIRLRKEILENSEFQSIIGASPAILAVFEKIKNVAGTDLSVIIYGETGTGKELVANAIHNLSGRKDKPFIKINSAAIPETLLESELFGYEKGAFTGALHRKKGKFDSADGGAIFFDEIGDMPLALQSKLLRIIETHAFERLGGNETITVDVRMIYATGKNLLHEVKEGRFREDLYYRINALPITLPPLRKRKEDIPLLVNYFLETAKKKTAKPHVSITAEATKMFLEYDYPGNVRELKHMIETSVTMCRNTYIRPGCACFPAELGKTMQEKTGLTPEYGPEYGKIPLSDMLKLFERDTIARILKETGGKKKEVAEKLGISRETLWRKIKEHGLSG
ncbi:MAG: two-component system response regulator [Nitrospirae bacterium GWB2_47_37]|nr:MAG: two-component system response regulator [Nitrospirae bacterium GWA2_46_11]OGW23542.1 MAG: two-component system response regulator [Nitrospirae bacterium GWB2_47_37]